MTWSWTARPLTFRPAAATSRNRSADPPITFRRDLSAPEITTTEFRAVEALEDPLRVTLLPRTNIEAGVAAVDPLEAEEVTSRAEVIEEDPLIAEEVTEVAAGVPTIVVSLMKKKET